MPDFWGEECHQRHLVRYQLIEAFQRFGYSLVELPLVEQTELYLRKSGEDIVAQIYDFVYHNRRLCLRPDVTTSVIRAYLEHFPIGSLQRFCYGGTVFRHEPMTSYRQFTQMGVELIGSNASIADGEVIYTACHSLAKIGLDNYGLVLGHIGILQQYLRKLGLSDRLVGILLAGMELLHQEGGRQKLENQLRESYLTKSETQQLAEVFGVMDEVSARDFILELLSSLRIEINGNRDPQEIADRLLGKLKHRDQTHKVLKAIEFMERLVQLRGKPQEVLPMAQQLLNEYEIDPQPLQEINNILQLLAIFNGTDNLPNNLPSYVSLDLGLTRGLQYYTGTIFELLDQQGNHLGGGGRYDDLVFTLGGNSSIPATGFSLNLEMVCQALKPKFHPVISVSIAPVQPELVPATIEIAQKLRELLPVQMVLDDLPTSGAFMVSVTAMHQCHLIDRRTGCEYQFTIPQLLEFITDQL
jgi:histidyl-tRNA synthetase